MKLTPHLLKEAEYRRTVFEIVLDPGTEFDDVLKPAFWAHVARRLKPRNRIEVHAADGSWYAELMVRSASHVSAFVSPVHHVTFDDMKAEADDLGDYLIKFRGAAKWSAIRNADKAVVVEGLASRAEVMAWLKKPQAQAA